MAIIAFHPSTQTPNSAPFFPFLRNTTLFKDFIRGLGVQGGFRSERLYSLFLSDNPRSSTDPFPYTHLP